MSVIASAAMIIPSVVIRQIHSPVQTEAGPRKIRQTGSPGQSCGIAGCADISVNGVAKQFREVEIVIVEYSQEDYSLYLKT